MELLSGNEAIARGAWEAGATIGVAYPGTPSTEAMEAFARFDDVYAEWCPNEKVAVEVGLGASAAGARVLATMKHVGVNVAADPLYTAAYSGVGGGFVILAADDPGMHSSQNEQDTRFHALGARIPVFEPSDSSEALAFTRDAFDFSERFDIPVFIRSTVRVSHTKCPVETSDRISCDPAPYRKDQAKWVMMPAFAKQRRLVLDGRLDAIRSYVEECPYNKIVPAVKANADSPKVGVVCAGAVFQHVHEALPEADILKLGITWPLPAAQIAQFARSVDALYVIEEASDFLSTQVKALGIEVSDTQVPLPAAGELSPGLIRAAFGKVLPDHREPEADLPGRPPALCPGCPHRLVFRELSRMRAIVTGDIGCYTLGALAPLSAMDTCIDMGASISMAHGFELGLADRKHAPVVAVIGDSTFAHSGITSLLNTVYNQGAGTVCILDNRTTAMTGRQGNPCNGVTLQNRPSREVDLPKLIEALGVNHIEQVDPQNLQEVRRALTAAVKEPSLSVVIFRSPCVLLERPVRKRYFIKDDCRGCGVCSLLGCPAISKDSESLKASIDPSLCVGCSQCAQICGFGCIAQEA